MRPRALSARAARTAPPYPHCAALWWRRERCATRGSRGVGSFPGSPRARAPPAGAPPKRMQCPRRAPSRCASDGPLARGS
eukprot:4783843-Prymnesium_polylepis.1